MATGSAVDGVTGADPVHLGWTTRQGRGIAALLAAMTLVTAVALRFWRLSWGLAEGEFFPDELIFGGRADVRFSIDAAGELYLYSKGDGMIRKVVGAMGF